MAVQRPNAIVFQEYANLTVIPDIPDLNVLIAGECYQILDYLDDKADCEAADYGTVDANTALAPPITTPAAVIISSPPKIEAGGELDADSVKIYFDAGQVVITNSPSPGGTSSAIYTSGDNLFTAHTDASGVHFGTEEVAVGDILYTEGTGTDDHKMTVKELCYTLDDSTTSSLNFVTNNVAPGDLVILANDQCTPSRDGTYIVKRVLSEDILEVVTAAWEGNFKTGLVLTVDVTVTAPNGTIRTSNTGIIVADYCNLRMTSDFDDTVVTGLGKRWRVERAISDVELETSDYVIVDNQVTLDAAIQVDLTGMSGGPFYVSFATAYMQYRALRTDLQQVTTLSNTTEILDTLGKFDARNPLCVGAIVAKSNTTTAVQIYGTTGSTQLDYNDFIDRISSSQDVYAIVPLTYDTSILASLLNMATTLADPTLALSDGFKQKFRVILGAVELQTTKYMVEATGGCTSSTKAATSPATIRKFTLSTTGTTPAPDLFTAGNYILPGDVFHIHDVGGPTVESYYTVVQVNDHYEIEVATDAAWGAGVLTHAAVGDYYEFTRAGVTVGTTKITVDGGPAVTNIKVTAAAVDDLYLVLNCPTANFLSSGCIPGDYLEMPVNPTINSATWTTPSIFEIDEVISNQKVRIVNNGNNTATVENELPHGGRRTLGTEITQGTMYCRVRRDLSKTQQVTEMVAVAQSFGNKRILLTYPSSVDVNSLVDGSLTRTDADTPEPADPQPGYYLACAVGGQTAGNPPQQGFTNMGIAGIDQIYNSTEYFTEQQLTDLSNGGIYVFVQDNANSLPYSIHEVTTDVSILEFSEYMVVKDFDFVSWTFLDTLLPFIGEWNVTTEAIEFIKQALYATGDTLKSRQVAKIGAPLIGYTMDSVAVNSTFPDRIEAYMQVEIPMTLNTIALHLVA